MSQVYDRGSTPEFSASMLKELIALAQVIYMKLRNKKQK